MFQQAKHKTGEATYGIGAITNGTLKMAIRITNMEKLPVSLIKGCPIAPIGTIPFDGPNPYIKVSNGTDVKIFEGPVMLANDMMEAVAMHSSVKRWSKAISCLEWQNSTPSILNTNIYCFLFCLLCWLRLLILFNPKLSVAKIKIYCMSIL